LVPRAEVEGDMGDSYMGLQARMMSQGLRKLSGVLAKSGTTCIFINQIRMKIGVMFGNPETTPGGNALKFFASQRVEIRRGDKLLVDKEQIGYLAKIKIAKNKISAPFKTAELPVKRGIGYDKTADIVEAATALKLVDRAGAFYTFGKQKFQGKEKFIAALDSDEKTRASIEKDIQNKVKEMRMGKKVIDDDALIAIEAEVEEDAAEALAEAGE
jgi:recombination protein RecA